LEREARWPVEDSGLVRASSIGSETYTGQSFLLVDGLTEDHTMSGIRIKSNVTRGGPVHDLVYRNICMRGVKNPIAISPYYTN
jgi:polygalacturonase